MPEPDVDERATLEAFASAGCEAETFAWQDGVPLGFDAVVLRSTWDYYLDASGFETWLRAVVSRCRLFNPLDVVLPNLHKRYLLELEAAGVPIVPTLFVRQGSDAEPMHSETGTVVKPAVGASSWKARSFARHDATGSHAYVRELSQEMDVLVQPYLPSVDAGGERSLVYIDGEFTHKVVKQPRFEGADESVSRAEALTTEEHDLGQAAVQAFMEWVNKTHASECPIYARVDVMESDGRLLVSELELAEPSLFFVQNPSSLEKFVRAVCARLS